MANEVNNKLIIEREYWRDLINSESGRHLIRRLIKHSGVMGCVASEGGGKDSYNKGRYDIVYQEVFSRIVNFFGYSVFDNI